MRNVVFRFEDSRAFARALHDGDQELLLPEGETVADGEWMLAIFEIVESRRATAAAARGLYRGDTGEQALGFERRDWERLVNFANTGSTVSDVSTWMVTGADWQVPGETTEHTV